MAKKNSGPTSRAPTTVLNRKARHEYTIEDRFEAGLVLQGWEVKSLRAGRGQIADSYVLIKNGEAWLLGSNITPLLSASSHIHPESTRTRKLLLHKKQLMNLVGLTQRQGYTLIPLNLHWVKGRAKLDVGLAIGKKQYDKRADEKDRDWARQKQHILKKAQR